MEIEEVEKSRMTTTMMVELDDQRQSPSRTTKTTSTTKTSTTKTSTSTKMIPVQVEMEEERERRPRVRSSERRCLGRMQSKSEGEDGWQIVDQVDNVDENLHSTLEVNLDQGLNERLKPEENNHRIGNHLEGNHLEGNNLQGNKYEGNNLEGNHHQIQDEHNDHFHQEEMSEAVRWVRERGAL